MLQFVEKQMSKLKFEIMQVVFKWQVGQLYWKIHNFCFVSIQEKLSGVAVCSIVIRYFHV